MRRSDFAKCAWPALLICASLVVCRGMAPASAFQPPDSATAPKLAVLVVVDQMRADYVDRFRADWAGGLKRFLTEGAWFSQAEYPYLRTVTCPGHATISTGTLPHTHGVVSNSWFDRERNATVGCVADQAANPVGYLGSAPGGQSAHYLMVPTFTDAMRTQRSAQVVAMSQKDRSAIMLGGHGPGIVTWLSARLDNVMTSSVFADQPVPVVKAFVDKHPLAAEYGKAWERALPPSKYPEADDGPFETPPAGWTRVFPHVFAGESGQPDARFREQWSRSPFVDAYFAELADHLLTNTRIGRTGTSDVLAIGFSGTDLVGHSFGPDSQEVHDTLVRVDRLLGRLFDRLDTLVGKGEWVAALSSDHGVTQRTEEALKRDDVGFVNTASVAAKIEQLLARRLGPGRYVASLQGETLQVYFTEGTYKRLQLAPGVLEEVVQMIMATPGIDRVVRSEEASSGLASSDPILRRAALSYFPGRSGDLILTLKRGWGALAGLSANHGASATPEDQRVPIFFLGKGIKRGEFREPATPADIAPTLAKLCNISMPNVEGHVLTAAIAAQPPSRR